MKKNESEDQIIEALVKVNDPDITTCAIQNLTWNKDRKILKQVLSRGLKFSLERRDNTGYTPLMAAVNLADYDIAKALLEAKANANVTDETDRSVIQLCALRCPQNRVKICQLLMQNGGRFCHPAFYGAYMGDMSAFSQGFVHESKTGRGSSEEQETPFEAKQQQQQQQRGGEERKGTRNVKRKNEVIESKKTVRLRQDGSGHTVLHYAAANGHLEFVKKVIERHPKAVSLVSKTGDTALLVAAKNGHLGCLQVLMAHASEESYKLTDKFGRDPLMCASRFGHTHVVKWLHEEKGAALNRQSAQDAESPLTCAAYGGYIDCIHYLLTKGAYHDDSVRIPNQPAPPPIPPVVRPFKCNCQANQRESFDDDKNINVDGNKKSKTDAQTPRKRSDSKKRTASSDFTSDEESTNRAEKTASLGCETPSSSSSLNQDLKLEGGKDLNDGQSDDEKTSQNSGNPEKHSQCHKHKQCQQHKISDEKMLHFNRLGLMPLLFYALEKSEVGVSKWLHQHGCSWANTLTHQLHHTAFMRAAVGGSVECLQWVANHSHDSVNAKTVDGCSALHYAVVNDNLRVARLLVEMGGTDNPDEAGNTLVLSAAKEGSLWCLQWLLERNESALEECNRLLQTPLLVAIAGNQAMTAKWLIKRGANIHAKDVNGHNLILMAAKAGSTEMIAWFLERKLGDGICARDAVGRTPLILAASCNHVEAVKLLLKHRADIGAMSICNLTPLLWASWLGCEKVIRCLLQNKACISDRSLAEENCLHLVAKCTQAPTSLATAKVLIQNGCKADLLDCQGKSPAYVASTYGNLSLLKWLIEQGYSKPEEVDHKGNPMLFATAETQHLNTVRYLVEAKASLVMGNLEHRGSNSKVGDTESKASGKCGPDHKHSCNNDNGDEDDESTGNSGSQTSDEDDDPDYSAKDSDEETTMMNSRFRKNNNYDAALLHAVYFKRVPIVRYLISQMDSMPLEQKAYKLSVDMKTREVIDSALQRRTYKELIRCNLKLLPYILRIASSYVCYDIEGSALTSMDNEATELKR